jgi:nicotinic acid mononucleotide adenylyltransferase
MSKIIARAAAEPSGGNKNVPIAAPQVLSLDLGAAAQADIMQSAFIQTSGRAKQKSPLLPAIPILQNKSAMVTSPTPSRRTSRDDLPPSAKKKTLLSPINAEEDAQSTPLIYSGNNNTAGVSVFEAIRRMQDERILTRDDRLALNAVLYNPDKRDALLKAIHDAELSMYNRFAVRRLKAIIHGNSAGEPGMQYRNIAEPTFASPVASKDGPVDTKETPPSMQRLNKSPEASIGHSSPNKSARKLNESPYSVSGTQQSDHMTPSPGRKMLVEVEYYGDEHSIASQDTMVALQQVLGNAPSYSDPACNNVCSKISGNLRKYLSRVKSGKSKPKTLAVIVGSGSYNPLTRMHLRTFYIAKQYLEKYHKFEVLGALMSPTHASVVRHRYRTCASEIIPPAHRLALAQLCVQDSKMISVDPWEITRRCAMDYLSLLDHVQKMLSNLFPDVYIKLFYLCKSNFVPKLSIEGLRKNNFACVCVSRAPEADQVRSSLGSRCNGVVFIAEDTALLDASLDTVSAKKVRDRLKEGKDVEELVGKAINDYIIFHGIAGKVLKLQTCICVSATSFPKKLFFLCKMRGEENWTEKDFKMPDIPKSNPSLSPGTSGDSLASGRFKFRQPVYTTSA